MKRTGNSKLAVVGWGRGMGHTGHMFLADAVITQAADMKADPYFFVSKTVGKDDPLFPEEKLAIYQTVFPKQKNIFTAEGNLNQALQELAKLGYQGVVLVVGADQKESFKYLEKPNKEGVPVYQSFGFSKLKVISRQETRSKFRSEEGPRATPMRQALLDPNVSDEEKYQVWRRDMPSALSDEQVADLMQKAQSRLLRTNKKKQVAETRIIDPKALINAFYVSPKGHRHRVAEKIPYYLLDKLVPLLTKKYAITMKDIEVRPADITQYRRSSQPELVEFAPDDGGGSRKFIPWTEFIEQVKQIVSKDFGCVENVVKTTIKARFVPHDPMEFGPTMLYSYYETRAGGRNKGAVSTRGSIQIGKYTGGGLTGQIEGKLLTTFSLLKGHPFERHFDLTFDNIYKIANIIMGNTQGALEFKPEQQVNEFAPSDDGDRGQEDMFFKYAKLWYNGNLQVQQRIEEVLAKAGWEIGELESEEGGAFIVQSGDEDGKTYMGWSAEDLGGQLNEFAPGNGDDGLPYAEYQVYQCNPEDQFDWIGGPLYQTDNMGMAHKYAYEQYVKHRPKAFMIWQERSQGSRGNYGVKGQSDGTEEINEGSQVERKITRVQSMIQDFHNRAKATKNDIKKNHYLQMADQLQSELDRLINDANEMERDGNIVSQHDSEASDTWNRGGLAEDYIDEK